MIAFPVWTSWEHYARPGVGDFWEHRRYYHIVDRLEWQGHPRRDSDSTVTWNRRWYP